MSVVVTILIAAVAVITGLVLLAGLIVIAFALASALRRTWSRLARPWRRKKVPSRNPDGRPLTVPERERMAWIEHGYTITAREPGRRR